MTHVKTLNKANLKESCCQGRLRRVPGFLPVCLQDFLHRCQPEVREPQPLNG